MKTITDFEAIPYKQGVSSVAVIIPKRKFTENTLQIGKKYNFIVQEIEESTPAEQA